MILEQNENITVITQEKATVIELVKKIQALYPKFKNDNVIVVLTSLKALGLSDITEFLQVSNTHRGSKHSFVIVSDKIDLDIVPDEIVVVPTLQEAYDIIEMEEMERDLGF
ncbi:ribonuclease Z [Sabulilitoribacter multivorans]|uniref:Ribonuclease Z n=1 Tax=Flaviramulus multivorans TaxID=1304750 RepID=A0ABS9III4_9FLAO|nr:ribonuclease Z [Flaviramulus multivorans]MCF7559972.1 ribonuclease Z [Flaviramulus multivorans]